MPAGRADRGEVWHPAPKELPMVAVLVTAIATWLILVVLDNVNVGSFLLESTIAVLGGAAIGLLVPWFMRRRRRSAA
jgi:hypothetical protein